MFRDRPFDHVGGQRNPSIPFEGLGRIFCFGGFFGRGRGGGGYDCFDHSSLFLVDSIVQVVYYSRPFPVRFGSFYCFISVISFLCFGF